MNEIIIGDPKPILYESKGKVLKEIYKRSQKNLFMKDLNYREFLKLQIHELGELKVKGFNEQEIFEGLKKVSWLKEIKKEVK